MSNRVTACIFDLDGVVVDTARYHYLAWKRLANSLGFEFSREQNEKLKGVSREQSLEFLLEAGGLNRSYNESQKAEMCFKKNAWYLEYIQAMTPDEILPGVTGFLHLLRDAGIKIGLGSASKNAGIILDRMGLSNRFDVTIDGHQITHVKPHPEVFLRAADALGVSPQYSVVFEDAVAGIEAAHNAGMRAIGVGDIVQLGEAEKVISGFEGATLQLLESI